MKNNFQAAKSHFAVAALAAIGATTMSVSTPSVQAQSGAPISVVLNGRVLDMGNTPPSQVGGRVLVPLRGVFESLGATVNYDAPTSTVYATRDATNVRLQLGSSQASVNGQTRVLDVPAQARFGRTLVPLRFVSETLGAQVQWVEAQRTVYITQGNTSGTVVTTPIDTVPSTPSYPGGNTSAGGITTMTGTVTRDLPGERRFEIVTDNGLVMTIRTPAGEPAIVAKGDRVRLTGQMVDNVFEADTARVIRAENRRVRTEGTVLSILSATRLTMRADDNRVLTVVATQPFAATITEGDRVRVPGTISGNFVTAERVVLVRNGNRTSNAGGQAVSFSGVVESVDSVSRVLQVRGDNGQSYLVRFNGANTFRRNGRVRVVGTFSGDITTASSVSRE